MFHSLYVYEFNFRHRGEEGWGLGGEGGGIRNADWQLEHSHEDVKYSIGSGVNHIDITVDGARWALELSGGVTSHIIELSDDCAEHLKPIQNNIKSKL